MDTTNTTTRVYTKHLVPLESDPLVLNDLMYGLGVSTSLALTDVVSIDDPIQLSFISRPVIALILVLPTSEEYERHRRSAGKTVEVAEDPKAEGVIWFRQTIDNACGLYAILHATCNFEIRGFIEPESLLSKLYACSSSEREALLNDSADVETVYNKAALRGSTLPPPADDDVDLHYVCFIKSPNGSVYEMDGDANGPVQTDITLKQGEDMLEASALEYVKRCITREDADMKFSLLTLVQNLSNSN